MNELKETILTKNSNFVTTTCFFHVGGFFAGMRAIYERNGNFHVRLFEEFMYYVVWRKLFFLYKKPYQLNSFPTRHIFVACIYGYFVNKNMARI